ncbi:MULTISPECIES: hypothetical protein [unclassified Sphingobium]|uniref:hypothetical protein n=1 Tax=unclassified Sphingobium TaxID=2611147 RepID=UPI002225816C|nr:MULTISPECIES: hypothetical protein [unclassified Sphingobium]MCW2395862.1 hypothetical protein [Sphingobium sp. B8D3B]MCW2419378.1 hypothetical protein [Sphingobium sp. B8D3C]
MTHIDISKPVTLYRQAQALEGQAALLRAQGKRDLAARADIAARQYRDAGEAIAYAQGMETLIAEALAPAAQVAA